MAQSINKAEPLNGICRRQIISAKNKTANIGFCDTACHHLSEMTEKKMCLCCGNTILHHQNYDTIMKRFEEIIKDNQGFLEGWKKWPSKQENRLYAWVKNGLYTYRIDMRMFVEYMDLAFTDGQDKYDNFFKHLERTCPRIMI